MHLPHLKKIQHKIRKKAKELGFVFKGKTKSSLAFISSDGDKHILGYEFENIGYGSVAISRGFLKLNFDNRKAKNDKAALLAIEYANLIADFHDIKTVLVAIDGADETFYQKNAFKPIEKMELDETTGLETGYYRYFKNVDNGSMIKFSNRFWSSIQNYKAIQPLFDYQIASEPGERINQITSNDILVLEKCRYRNNYYDSTLFLYMEKGQVFIKDQISSVKHTIHSINELTDIINDIMSRGLDEQRLLNLMNPSLKYMKERIFIGEEVEELYDLVKDYLLDECNIDGEQIEFAAKENLYVFSCGRMTYSTPFMLILHIVDKTIVIEKAASGKHILSSFDIPKEGLDFYLDRYTGDIHKYDLEEQKKYTKYREEEEREFYRDFIKFSMLKDKLKKVEDYQQLLNS